MEKPDPLKSKTSEHHFGEAHFEKSLSNLKNTQESISQLSSWCLQHKQHHKKIVNCWFKVMKKAKMENRLILFYLANDVIQYSKKKNYDFVNTWALFLQRAVTLVRDDKVKTNITRIFRIWGERGIYDEAFIADLNGLLDCQKGVSSDTAKLVAEFQPLRLVDKIRGCKILEDDTDLKLKHIKEYPLDLTNADTLRSSLKDRRHGADLVSEVDQGMSKIQSYVTSLKEEIMERAKLIELLEQGEVFYEHQKGEAKIVVTAYKNFGIKVKKLKKHADELLPSLASPVPSPDINAPSPSGSDDLQLPDPPGSSNYNEVSEQVAAQTAYNPNVFGPSGSDMRMGSFIGSNISFDFQSFREPPPTMPPLDNGIPNNQIEVIGGKSTNPKKPDEGFIIDEFLKSLNPAPAPPMQPPRQMNLQPPLPPMPQHLAAPLLNNFSAPPPPPPPEPPRQRGFHHSNEPPEWKNFNDWKGPRNPWNNSHDIEWSAPEKKMKFEDGPHSPPMFEKEGFNQPVQYDDRTGVVPEDVDHRGARLKKDIDHRNLISLTGPLNAALKSNRKSIDDSDMRSIPPLLSKKFEPPLGVLMKEMRRDLNMESVDMDLSDEDGDPFKKKRNGSGGPKAPLLPTPAADEEDSEWNPPPPGAEEDMSFQSQPVFEEMKPHIQGPRGPMHLAEPFNGPPNDMFTSDHFGDMMNDQFGGPPVGFGGPMGPVSGPPPSGPFRPRGNYGKYNPGYTPGFTNRGGGNGSMGTPPMLRGAPPRFRGPSPMRPFRGGRGRASFARW
ncbi:regulation of nuclear pre-mRNA domain-containing protein 2 [Neocloeon triangulifer]|uniref:regulation of nuclear pre-mRNA domain-containing protein 2 n=1 Tax=Neocloeon triangulifer TaxID=2078957 RepID=UPI00286EDD61|nr:regulation of nuclear pre-mRNA domain-containing protein 2 [Neocloeon triangulifer]